jgi:hypothetical protein
MIELEVSASAEELFAACRDLGLRVGREGALATKPGSRHWHLTMPGRTGTLGVTEVTEPGLVEGRGRA